MKRRTFVQSGILATAVAATGSLRSCAFRHYSWCVDGQAYAGFSWPSPRTWACLKTTRGKDPIDQLKLVADRGSRQSKDSQMKGSPVDLQKSMGESRWRNSAFRWEHLLAHNICG